MFDKIIKALYGDVDQYDAEVRGCRQGLLWGLSCKTQDADWIHMCPVARSLYLSSSVC